MSRRSLSVIQIRAQFDEMKQRPLNLISLEEAELLCSQSEAGLREAFSGNDGMLSRAYEQGFVERYRDFAKISKLDHAAREKYIVEVLLPESRARIACAPSLNFQSIRLSELPFYTSSATSRAQRKPYAYDRLVFDGALLHHAALINAIKGRADVSKIGWLVTGPIPSDSRRIYTAEEKIAYLKLSEIVLEAYELALTPAGLRPRGIQALWDTVIDPKKDIFQIMDAVKAHCRSKRSGMFSHCWVSGIYGRLAPVENFYQKWSRDQAPIPAPITERSSLLSSTADEGPSRPGNPF